MDQQRLFDSVRSSGRPVQRDLRFLKDVGLLCTVELGSAAITVRQLLRLAVGSIIPLDRLGGDPVEIRANGNSIARGEVVVVNDHFGVRITEVVDRRG
jgi:flagellar motor switch protein FliN